jgi:hypothetical protein
MDPQKQPIPSAFLQPPPSLNCNSCGFKLTHYPVLRNHFQTVGRYAANTGMYTKRFSAMNIPVAVRVSVATRVSKNGDLDVLRQHVGCGENQLSVNNARNSGVTSGVTSFCKLRNFGARCCA